MGPRLWIAAPKACTLKLAGREEEVAIIAVLD